MVMYGLMCQEELLGTNCHGFSDDSADTNWELELPSYGGHGVWLVASKEVAERVATSSSRSVYWGCANDYTQPQNDYVGKCKVVEVEITVKG